MSRGLGVMQRAILQAYDDLRREGTWPQMTGLFVCDIRDRVYEQHGVRGGEHPSSALCVSFSRALRTLVTHGAVEAIYRSTYGWTRGGRDHIVRIVRTEADAP